MDDVLGQRKMCICVMEEARRTHNRVAMGGGKRETLFADCDLVITSKGELSGREN